MWFNVGLYCHAPWRHMKGRSRDIYGAGAGDGLAQDISPHPGAMMNFNDQNRICHAERSEASLCPSRETLRFAQGDNTFPILLVKVHNRAATPSLRAVILTHGAYYALQP